MSVDRTQAAGETAENNISSSTVHSYRKSWTVEKIIEKYVVFEKIVECIGLDLKKSLRTDYPLHFKILKWKRRDNDIKIIAFSTNEMTNFWKIPEMAGKNKKFNLRPNRFLTSSIPMIQIGILHSAQSLFGMYNWIMFRVDFEIWQ